MSLWYLSFASTTGPRDRFLGAAAVHADSFLDAVEKTHDLGINPGGEVMAAEVPPEDWPDAKHLDRLLTMDEIQAIWPGQIQRLGDVDPALRAEIEVLAPAVCECCNRRVIH